jgi:hypothetical protein
MEQTIDQIDSLVYHIRSRSFVEDAMIISYEQLQLELGSQSSVFSLDFDTWGYLETPSWMTALWRGASKFNVQLTLFSHKNLPLQRSRDRFLMDQVMTLELRADEIIAFNRVRNFMKVYSIADITSADGRSIRPEFRSRSGYLASPKPVSTYTWR